MTTRTTRTVTMGVTGINPSDVLTGVANNGGNDLVDAVHDAYPESGTLDATQTGARIHLVGFPDTVEGSPYQPAVSSVASATGILPDIWGAVGAATNTFADNTTWTVDSKTDRTTPAFFAFYLTVDATAPSGCIFEVGDSTDGAYVGWVGGYLVIRNGTGADLRVLMTTDNMLGKTGTLFVEFNPDTGTVQAWFGEEDTTQCIYLGVSGSAPGNWHGDVTDGGADGGAYHRAANGTANIEAPGTGTPTTADDRHTNTYSSSFSANMPTHAVGDMLIACVSLHPYGGDNLVDATVSGWERILDHDGAAGSYAPTAQIFTKIATKTTEKCQVSVTGATRNWEKTVVVMTVEDCSDVTATLGDVQNGGNSTIDFPAAVGSPGLVLHGLIGSVKTNLNVPGSDTLVESSEYYPRTQLWSETSSTAAITNHPIGTYPAHTSVTLNCFGGTANEGTLAANGTVATVSGPTKGPNADGWENTLAPGNIMAIGTPDDPGEPSIPETDATPYTAGSQDSTYSELSNGSYLESVAVRLVQSRTANGIWGARLFAYDDAGEFVYGSPLLRPFDVTQDQEISDRLLTKQSSLGTGLSWHDAVTDGAHVGVLLETDTEDALGTFGTAKLDVAEVELTWAVPPQATILYPVTGTTPPTATIPVGWSIAAEDTQTSYRVRIWETFSYNSALPDNGRIAYDSGKIFSQSVRSHQCTRPLRPDVDYTVGVLLEGESINGRPLVSPWATVQITAPSSVIPNYAPGATVITEPGFVRLDGVSDRASTPDVPAAGTVSDDIDFKIWCSPDDITPTVAECLGGRWLTGGNKRGWNFYIVPAGQLQFYSSVDGTAAGTNNNSTASITGAMRGFRFVYDQTADTITFYTTTDNEGFDAEWTQLGNVLTSVTKNVFNTDADLMLGATEGGGANEFNGTIYRAELTVAGAIVANPQLDSMLTGSTFVDEYANTWTVTGAAITYAKSDTYVPIEATARTDGTVLLETATFPDIEGTWAQIERARVADLDAAAEDPVVDVPMRMVEAHSVWAKPWQTVTPIGYPAATSGTVLKAEWWGIIHTDCDEWDEQNYLLHFAGSQPGSCRILQANTGVLRFLCNDDTVTWSLQSAVKPPYNTYLGVRGEFNLAEETGSLEWSIDGGVTWTIADTTVSNNVGPITGPATLATVEEYGFGGHFTISKDASFNGLTKHHKAFVEVDGVKIMDIDTDRDTTGVGIPASWTDPSTGQDFDIDGTAIEVVQVGSTAAKYPQRVGVVGAATNTGTTGASGLQMPLPAAVQAMDWTFFSFEWFGMIPTRTTDNPYSIFSMHNNSDGKIIFRLDAMNDHSLRVEQQNAADQTYRWFFYDLLTLDLYNKWIGFRCDSQSDDGFAVFYYTVDDGKTWNLFGTWDPSPGGSAADPITVRPGDANDIMVLSAGYNVGDFGHTITESFKLYEHELTTNVPGNKLIDVNLSRDNPTLADSFLDPDNNTWTINEFSSFTSRAAARVVPPSEVDDLWHPVVGLREASVASPTSSGGPRVQFVDPAPPQHEEIIYRVKIIDEPTSTTFESLSTDWIESKPVEVASDTWWLSSLDGTKRFGLEPSAAGWTRDRPGSVAAGIGRTGHVVNRDVLKDRTVGVEVFTETQDELDMLEDLLVPGDPMYLTDVHGRVSIVQPTGTVDTQPVVSLAPPGESAPVGRTYATRFTLVEVEDPRDFGYGTNLTTTVR